MKKILKLMNIKKICMLLSFVFISGLALISGMKNVNAARISDKPLTYQGKKVMYWRRYNLDDFQADSWNDGSYYEIDGVVAYCIEPGVHTEDDLIYADGSTDGSKMGFDDDVIEYISLIAHYGYGYRGHDSIKYYMAAQGLIWDKILNDKEKTTYWYYKPNQNDRINITNEQNEILNLVSKHYDKPSFNNESYTLQVGETITLTDSKNVLSDFDISVNGADYTLNGNTITITPKKSGKIAITFTKKQEYNESCLFYYSEKYQNLMTMGNVDPVQTRVTINAYYGAIELNKADSETGISQGQATLKGAKYGVYNLSGELLTTITTNENGYGKSEAVLQYGAYYVQEISPSTGYYLDNTRYDVDVMGTANVTMNVTENVIKNYISLLKQYDYVDGNTTLINAESGITFEIYYPDGNLYDSITTDKNGYATINIPYGVWRFHQVNTNAGFEKIYDFYITVDENSELKQYYNVLNNKLSAYLQVVKIDKDTGETIAIADTTFKILNVDTNQYVSQYVGGKVYSEFKTDETGKFVTYLKLEAGNYKLVEISSPKDYLINPDGLLFTIGDGTHYDYTTYGAFITVYFENKVIKGQIEINKKGESIKIENGSYTYEEKPLENVTFEIYAKEDIFSSDGNTLYYEKDQLVDKITTNKDGYAISKELYLGSYYIIETKTDNDYVLDTRKYEFTLTAKDNKTPIVYYSYSALNLLKKGTLEFTKTDVTTGKEIPNTKVEIYHVKDGDTSELIFTGITDENGKIIIDDLFVGKYFIVETDPATGYRLSEEVVPFEIKENGEIVKANMTNERIEMPKTFNTDLTSILIIGSTALVGMCLLFYAKKKKD